jgi:hypothetical protein
MGWRRRGVVMDLKRKVKERKKKKESKTFFKWGDPYPKAEIEIQAWMIMSNG